MKYKVVFLDLDGTLLSQQEKIPAVTRESVLRAQRRGITAVICSGRTASGIERILRKNRLQMSYIALNGAYAYDAFRRTVIYRRGLSFQMCAAISNVNRQLSLPGLWYTEEQTVSQFPRFGFFSRRPFRGHSVNGGTDEPSGFLKCAVVCRNAAKMPSVRQRFESLSLLEVSTSAPMLLELNAKGVTKGTGVIRFLEHCGCTLQEAVAVGDYENDISMIRAAGLGVAMGNAIPAVKEAADFVTSANTDNGVGKLLDSLAENG